jgi:hypothetical protein
MELEVQRAYSIRYNTIRGARKRDFDPTYRCGASTGREEGAVLWCAPR